MSRKVTTYTCDECEEAWPTENEAAQCERGHREERVRSGLDKRWRAIADDGWRFTGEDLTAIEAILARRLKAVSTPTTGETEGA